MAPLPFLGQSLDRMLAMIGRIPVSADPAPCVVVFASSDVEVQVGAGSTCSKPKSRYTRWARQRLHRQRADFTTRPHPSRGHLPWQAYRSDRTGGDGSEPKAGAVLRSIAGLLLLDQFIPWPLLKPAHFCAKSAHLLSMAITEIAVISKF